MTAVVEAAIPSDEARRLDAVHRYDLLDTPADGAFDRITALAARMLGVPIAIVSVVDNDRIWFKSHHGIDLTEIGRDPGLCASAILHHEPWVVTDAATDPRTLANPLVAGSFGLRFYLGVPLTTSDGFNLGTLCVIDHQPRTVSSTDVANLEDLAALVMAELELRLTARRTVEVEGRLRREAEELAEALQRSLLPPRPPELPEMELATRYLAGEQGLQVGGDFFDVFRLSSNDWGIVLGDVCGRGARPASLAALARWTIRASSVHQFSPSDVLRDVNAVFVADEGGAPGVVDDDAESDTHYCSAVFARLQLDTCGAWMTVANAGHPPPVLVRRSGKVEARTSAAFPIGLFDTLDPVDDRIGLGPGDALVLYTDGITETRDASGAMFGDEGLVDVLSGLTGEAADVIADAVIAAARAFSGNQLNDDVALLVIRVPDDAGDDPLVRLSSATGVPVDRLELPGYPHGEGGVPGVGGSEGGVPGVGGSR